MRDLNSAVYRAVVVSLLCFTSSTWAAQPQTTVPEKRFVRDHAARHAEKVAQAKTGKAQWVMIGDSITHNWERQRNYAERFSPYHTLNLGFGGDRTENALWRIQNGEIDGVSPKLVTLLLGTNNIPQEDSPSDIAAGIRAVVAELRQRLPDARIVIFSILPRNHHKVEGDFTVAQEVNNLLPAIADGKHVFHVDITQAFLDDSGQPNPTLYGRDLLHLSSEGYAVWWNALQPILTEVGLKESSPALTSDDSVIRLWPIERVGGEQNRLHEEVRGKGTRKLLSVIKDPNLTVFKVDSDKPTPAVVYCPGGAYKVLGPQPELVEWLNDQGITVFMLKYTIPDNRDAAFEDVQRAMRLLRHQAGKWNIDPNQLGVVGQSAGGHLIARLSQNYTEATYEPIDDADQESSEPTFAVVISGAYFLGPKNEGPGLADEFHMHSKVAPTFLVYARDDKWCAGGQAYEKGLREAGFSTRIQLYEKGGHGLGGVDWYPVCGEWMKSLGLIK